MLASTTILLIVCIYMVALFVIAQLIENRAGTPTHRFLQPVIYALAITVFCSSWSFYGSVSTAVNSGFMFFALYAGAILAVLCWRQLLIPLIRATNIYHITSIADFISARYNRSQALAAVVTLIALTGTIPYLALQLKAVIGSYQVITMPAAEDIEQSTLTGVVVTLLMILFTIMFGARRLDASEHHPGMMGVLAVQGLIKLGAFMALGIYVTYDLYQGFGDVFEYIAWGGLGHLLTSQTGEGSVFIQWMTLIVLGAVAIQCLPRQFHVAVVENTNERHLSMAMWLVPIYLILLSIFVIPIAAAGLLYGVPAAEADLFMIRLPQLTDNLWLALVVFLGGFSAASAMTIVSAVALSTMATNHLLMPMIERIKPLRFLRPYLLQCRWLMIALILSSSYVFVWVFEDTYVLANMGTIALVAALQFVPALFGGIFWAGANKVGAIAGLCAGFVVWFYTLVFPGFAELAWIPMSVINEGLFGLHWLRPHALLGSDELAPLPHGVFWSALFNLLFYVLGSLVHRPSKLERTQLNEFMKALESAEMGHRSRPKGLDSYIELNPKCNEAVQLLTDYMPSERAEKSVKHIKDTLQVHDRSSISIIELVEFHRLLENVLAGSIGTAGAHTIMDQRITYSSRETQDLKAIYSHIQSELNSPAASGNTAKPEPGTPYSSIEKLQNQLDQKEEALSQKEQELEKALQLRDSSDQKLFEQRLTNQKLVQEIKALRARINDSLEGSSR